MYTGVEVLLERKLVVHARLNVGGVNMMPTAKQKPRGGGTGNIRHEVVEQGRGGRKRRNQFDVDDDDDEAVLRKGS